MNRQSDYRNSDFEAQYQSKSSGQETFPLKMADSETSIVKTTRTLKIEDEKTLQRFTEIAEYFLKNRCEGKVLYKSGLKNNFEWRPMCYASQNFRAYYAIELFGIRSELTYNAFKTAVDRELVDVSLFRDITKIASIGCGPGAEMWGFKIFCEELLPFSSNTSNSTRKPPRFVGYDCELGWMPFVESLDFEFVNKEVTAQSLKDMMPTDVILLSYFAKIARVNILSEKTSAFWDEIEKKGNFIMVIETPDEKLHSLLESRGYSMFVLNDKHAKQCQIHCLQRNDYAVLRRTHNARFTR